MKRLSLPLFFCMLGFDVSAVIMYGLYVGKESPIAVAVVVLIGYIIFHALSIYKGRYKKP